MIAPGFYTVATVEDGEARWETLSQALAREPIQPVAVSPRQRRILFFLAQYHRQHQLSPSYEEIRRAVGFHHRSAVSYQMAQLVAKGLVEHYPNRTLGITLNVTL